MLIHADDLLADAAKTFKERRAVYGYNYLKVGGIFASLFPQGVTLTTPEDFIRFELLMMKVVKLSRYAENWSKGGHSDSLTDDAVYSQMLNAVDMDIAATTPPF